MQISRLESYKQIKETAKEHFGTEACKEFIHACLASATDLARLRKREQANEEAQKASELAEKLFPGD